MSGLLRQCLDEGKAGSPGWPAGMPLTVGTIFVAWEGAQYEYHRMD